MDDCVCSIEWSVEAYSGASQDGPQTIDGIGIAVVRVVPQYPGNVTHCILLCFALCGSIVAKCHSMQVGRQKWNAIGNACQLFALVGSMCWSWL